ncbi:MAG: UDP-N-acetylmuramoyl-L-alanyl-D-glutamate--2,6-diaminopimelate ligase [Ruminococcaceae bacterium]|nr:UDP-N-acetylmuramoyl-L-alanyl-D-glutamate--2,6-diaminopimelate ligase [Oscillospiraceae bacterium]
MLLSVLLAAAGYALPAGIKDREITGITSDSRTVRDGFLFVAIRGMRQDGNAFLRDAFRRGAAFAVCERCAGCSEVLVTENARAALARLLDAWYGHPARGMTLIGITGTNGKTSTATMLHSIFTHAGLRCGLIGTVECRLGEEPMLTEGSDPLSNMTTPDPEQLYALLARMRDGGATHAVMEVTSHALALDKVVPLCFERAVFTNLTPDHLDLHGDMESYYLEKRKLFAMAKGGVISCLSPIGERLADELDIPVWRVERGMLDKLEKRGASGVSFTLQLPSGMPLPLEIPVPGDFSVENGALAAITAVSLGISPTAVQEALSRFPGVRGRMERVSQQPTVLLDYAHTPDALEKLLRTVRGFCEARQRITVLFGCGGDRDPSKRREMGRIASALADLVILTSDNCRFERCEDILREILRGVDKEKPYRVIPDRRAAILYAIGTARESDVILLAGKGHENYEIQGAERRYFSEKEIVAEALAARRGEGQDADLSL